VNISTAAFSNENLLNQLALNSTYTAVYALYALRHEADAAAVYGKMPAEKIIGIVRRASGLPDSAFTSPQLPLLHRVPAVQPRPRPLNLVIVLEESLGAQFVGCLGGMPLTPEFDALSKEGLLLTRLYATGTRTVRGIEAVVSGFPPSPALSTVKLGMSQRGFFTPADLLGRHGYDSWFFYGGESHFDNMRSFFQGNGFARVVDQPLFDQPEFLGVWGVCDGDLARRAADDLAKMGDQPFLAVMLSTSNHVPFEFPDGHIELYEQPKQTRHNAMKYADWAIGEFFRKARTHAYFKDTIFLVVADHNIRTVGSSLVPVHGFRIPGLIIGPGFAPGTYDRICSQLDLLPTILPRLGLDLEHPLIGHDLLGLPADFPGRAIMQFADAHGYRVGNRLVVHQPREPARRFTLDGQDRSTPTDEAWPELTEEALAHALLSTHLYRHRLHALPAK
jgi:phosphoglycerol transferase MdoB-like AlkP superfamily enzyme